MSHMAAPPDLTQLFAIAAALGWASGLRLYAAAFLTGLAGAMGWVDLPPGLVLLQTPAILWICGGLVVVEFLADKIPWVDSMWDMVHTVIRIPGGAALAWGVFAGGDQAAWANEAALLGGLLAATAHTAKTTTRAAANTSPEPLSNLLLSLVDDIAVPAMLWLAGTSPWLFALALALVLALMVTVTVIFFRFLRVLFSRVRKRVAATG